MEGSFVVNLAARYAAAFGIMEVNKRINEVVIIPEDNKYQVMFFDDFDTTFEEMTFSYNDRELFFSKMLEGESSSIFAPPLIINFSREKNIIETEVNGSDHVIVERWGTRPWQLNITGILIDVVNRNYPSDKVKELHQFFEHNNVIEVVGKQFEDKDISSVYLKSVNIRPVEGFQDTIQFEITANSIKDVYYNLMSSE